MNTKYTLTINITPDQARIAWINSERKLERIQIEPTQQQTTNRGNIYVAEILRKESSLNAYFATYQKTPTEKQGFLPWKETHTGISKNNMLAPDGENKDNAISGNNNLNIGNKILVQINRDERDGKGAALTTLISLAGAFLVLMPNNPEASGISRKAEGNCRDEAKKLIEELKFPAHMGVIIRTSGLTCTKEQLQSDLDQLIKQWQEIATGASMVNEPKLIHQEIFGIKKMLRDALNNNVEKILIDDKNTFETVKKIIENTRPDYEGEIEYYDKQAPMFTHFGIQNQFETIFERKVNLKSGGSIVIDRTEALTAIDVNSGKSTSGSSIEETALKTNLEAADEIARQLKLRDIGGIIVIDFIDMFSSDARAHVEDRFNQILKKDSAKIKTYEISSLGLLEMSRQRLKPSVGDHNLIPCGNCNQRGFVRSAESFSSSIMHLIEEHSYYANNQVVQLQLSPQVANFIWNNKASSIRALEQKYSTEIIIIANPDYSISKYQIKKLSLNKNQCSAIEKEEKLHQDMSNHHKTKYQRPAPKIKEAGLFTKIWQAVFKETEATKPKKTTQRKQHRRHPHRSSQKPNHGDKRQNYRGNRKKSNHNKNNNIGKTPNSNSSKDQEYL